jgi:hypothetical protein
MGARFRALTLYPISAARARRFLVWGSLDGPQNLKRNARTILRKSAANRSKIQPHRGRRKLFCAAMTNSLDRLFALWHMLC